VALEAWSTAAPGRLEVATTSAPDLASNRRVLGADGKWINDWVDPEGRHTGPFDSLVTLLGIRRPDGSLAGLLVTYGCHPVVMGPRSMVISADYCGALKRVLEERGVAGTVLFGVSGHGDIDPRVCVQNDPREADRMGGLLAGIVASAVADLRPLEAGPVAWHQEPWSITRTHGMEETADMQFLRLIRAGEVFETEVTALRCGSVAIVGLPGEALTQIVSAVRRHSPLDHTVVLSLANDTVGYLPTDEVQRQGSHEANYAPATGLEGPLLERTRAALRAVEQSKGGVA
jgi:neutral ceramidase